ETRRQWQHKYGADAELLNAAELNQLEPHVSPLAQGALYYPHEAHVYAPGYVAALEEACRRTGVRVRDGLGRVEIARWQAGAELLSAEGERFHADLLVVCSGAWAGLLEESFGMTLPVYPIRGQ